MLVYLLPCLLMNSVPNEIKPCHFYLETLPKNCFRWYISEARMDWRSQQTVRYKKFFFMFEEKK